MSRLTAIDSATATGKAKELLDAVQAKLKITPNMTKVMANSPAVLEAYLSFSGALAGGQLPAKLREQIALEVAELNSCQYCLSAHTAIGKMVGLRPAEIGASRHAHSADAKRDAGLQFVQALVVQRGEVSDKALAEVRAAGTAGTARCPIRQRMSAAASVRGPVGQEAASATSGASLAPVAVGTASTTVAACNT